MALSLDLRERIIEAYENKEGSIRALAKRFKVGFATIWRLLKRYRNEGDLNPQSPPGRKSKINKAGLKLIEKLINKNKDITLSELCEALMTQQGIQVSLMAMHRACKRLELHYKENNLSSRTAT